MKSNPLLSIIIPTRNSAASLEECLLAVQNQTYKNIEIIISDGHSTDNTLSIAKKYNARIVANHKLLAEPGVTLGFQESHGDILIVLAIDNIFRDEFAFERLAKIFSNPEIFAAFPKHVSSKSDSIFTKYVNTFTDPFNHFLYGYASNSRTFNKIFKTLEHTNLYDLYDFKSSNINPVIAVAQGFAVRREFLNIKRNEMDDISPVLNLIKEGKKIAYAHSIDLYHHTIKNMNHFIRKQRWATKNAFMGETFGINSRSHLLTMSQKIMVYFYPAYSISVVLPCINALCHLIIDRESMWIFHPIISFLSGFSIVYEISRLKLGLTKEISRQ